MATIESIQKAYIDFVLTEGEQPKSVYIFAKKNKMAEEEFYRFFGSFDAVEQNLWTGFAVKTIAEIKTQEVWSQYTSREKALSFFYSFFELIKGSRSFVVYSIKKQPKTFNTPQIFQGIKDVFENFCNDLIVEGIESSELSDRKFFTNRYKDALWVQLVFILNFWINDISAGFEKTDEAIEKGINVTFDLFQRSPIDNLFEYGKFLAKTVALKKKWALEITSLTQPSPGERALEDLGKATFAAIFDMDGTLIDNTPYHFKSWQMLFKKYGKGELSKQEYYTYISGVPVIETIKSVFGAGRDEAQLKELLDEKENFYREAYAPFLAPINGLENFLTDLKDAGVKMAMATSATVQDIDFILNKIPIRDNFDEIVNSTMVSKPKPNPQIFLKAAEKLNKQPADCVVFEDSLAGIKAANSAGMKVIAITTGHTAAELHPVDLVINDYSELTVQKLAALFIKH